MRTSRIDIVLLKETKIVANILSFDKVKLVGEEAD